FDTSFVQQHFAAGLPANGGPCPNQNALILASAWAHWRGESVRHNHRAQFLARTGQYIVDDGAANWTVDITSRSDKGDAILTLNGNEHAWMSSWEPGQSCMVYTLDEREFALQIDPVRNPVEDLIGADVDGSSEAGLDYLRIHAIP